MVPCDTVEAVWLDDLNALSDDEWGDLASSAATPNPFYEHWYLRPALRHLAAGTDARILIVQKAGKLVGLCPFVRASRYGRLPLPHVENWVHYHCFFGEPLVRKGAEHLYWRNALALLDREASGCHMLHLVGLDEQSPLIGALRETRRTDIVHRSRRALLSAGLSASAYYEANVRKKKRKEIERLRNRLAEIGPIAFARLSAMNSVTDWARDFLRLEASGWKGRAGTALAAAADTSAFLTEAISGAAAAKKLEMIRMTVGDRTVAMLINFLTPPGSFSFKIAFDEDFARYSPGVMIQIENLALLDRAEIDWMDSCAVEDHPMINTLWKDRREIVRLTVPLSGMRRSIIFHAARALENVSSRLRGRP